MVPRPSLLALFFTALYCNGVAAAGGSPIFTPKSYLQHYWQKHISNALPMPEFLLNKASPLSASQFAVFSNLADQNSLSSHLPDFCSKANLLCTFQDDSASQHDSNSNSDPVFWPNLCLTYKLTYNCKLLSTSSTAHEQNHIIRGLFFREATLKTNTIMPMPDVADKMPTSSFLPQRIASKLPFSASELQHIFHAANNNSKMSTVISDAVTECRTLPSPGETKRCVASIEDMIDFATSVLGRNVAVRAMDVAESANANILLGSVKPINRGRVTNAVSCHRRLFPYSLYYCHAIPNVRLYEAQILNPNLKAAKIIHGTAICHLDTSSWTPGHGAFMALGSGPGKIEVCHWIFGDDMIWTVAD